MLVPGPATDWTSPIAFAELLSCVSLRLGMCNILCLRSGLFIEAALLIGFQSAPDASSFWVVMIDIAFWICMMCEIEGSVRSVESIGSSPDRIFY